MRRFFAEPDRFRDNYVTLSEEEARHLRDVLRLREGRVKVFNGIGGEFLAEIEKVDKRSASLRVLEQLPPASPESPLDLVLAAAVLKGEKFDLVIQKAVELGVTRLIPLATVRADVKLKEGSSKIQRWKKIALEACKQSGRARLMSIDDTANFSDFARSIDHTESNALMFAERGGKSLSWDIPGKRITALIGPEGGWDDSELETARSAGIALITLGGRIMRAETAAIAIVAILQNRLGDLC